MTYADRLHAAIERTGNACLLGIDPHLDALPAPFALARDPGAPRAARATALGDFCCELVDLAADRVPAVKPQSAFFEVFGADGHAQWERVVARAHARGLLVIGDVKRSDIASTAAAYATAYLEGPGGTDPAHLCDAVTVNPFLGEESVRPFLDACARTGTGVYVLVRTSNPGSAEFQLCGDPPLSDRVAMAVHRWGSEPALLGACGLSSVGAVVGATHPEALASLRALMPRTPLLLPGYGAQGGTAAELAGAFLPGGQGVLVNSSRGIAFAHKQAGRPDAEWVAAASDALDVMITEITAVAQAPA